MRTTPIHAFNYYHIYNRGINQGLIYFAKENYRFFLDRLAKYFNPDKARIISYCLMPSHYHLLVYPLTDDFGNHVMQPFSVSYTKAINKRRARSGPLFEGPYQARLVDEDKYLLHLSRYIHFNPVSAGLVDRAEDWEFSSYKEYIGFRREDMVNSDIILQQFHDTADYADFVFSETDPDSGLPTSLLIDS